MITIAPKSRNFNHAGQLPKKFDTPDPRTTTFRLRELDIDLRECDFVRPAAALWCAVYCGLAVRRGCRCRLLVPSNMGVCLFLKSLGLFDLLKSLEVEVDDRDIGTCGDQKTILPITRFGSTAQASQVTNEAFTKLQSANIGAVSLTSVVTELFSELALNAVQHSDSPLGAFGCVQVVETRGGPRFTCTVADAGIGVRESLRKNEKLRQRVVYDWDALELAIRERVSGTGDAHRGIGLYGVSEDLRARNRSLFLHSGLGSLEVTEILEVAARRTRLFPGTLAYLSIPT